MERTDYGETVVVRHPVGEPGHQERSYVEPRERKHVRAEDRGEWPVRWSSVWIGALLSLTAALVLTLVASAIGDADAAAHPTSWAAFTRAALIYSIVTALVAFFVGGFMAARISGVAHAESGLLHGALTWLVTLPVLLVLGGIGAGHFFGNFGIGLLAPPVWIAPAAGNVPAVDAAAAGAARDIAVSAAFVVVMGLLGGMLGGWIGSEELSGANARLPWSRTASR
ncbi:MAG TPA: hypothetical protein VMW62_16690 [Chloroflexota bacterium]|nr:hypothetical protein [Chloroflexota bacterium]